MASYGPRVNQHDGRVISNSIVQALKGEDITLVLKPGGCDAFLPLI
jgi:hypothetical protein